MEEIFRFEKISKKFSDQFVLNDFSLTVEAYQKIVITGCSGIGKSTLFKLLLGFELPDHGSIYFKGKKIDEKTIWNLRKEVAYVPQDVSVDSGSVRDFFDKTLALKNNVSLKSREQVIQHLQFFNLHEDVLEKSIESLSGGERQRVVIVNALLLNRKIYLLDEVTSALDEALRCKVADYFFLNKDLTVMAISHDNYIPESANAIHIKLDDK